jgi:plasmid stability protein
MAVLNIRNLPPDVHRQLRIRAAKAGRSMEAEARQILLDACRGGRRRRAPHTLQDLVDELYVRRRPSGVVDSLIKDRRREARRE